MISQSLHCLLVDTRYFTASIGKTNIFFLLFLLLWILIFSSHSQKQSLTHQYLLQGVLSHNKKLTSYYPAQFASSMKTILGALLGTHCTADQSLFNSGTLSARKYPSLFAWATSCFCFQGSFWKDKTIGQQAMALHDRQEVPGKRFSEEHLWGMFIHLRWQFHFASHKDQIYKMS